MKRLLPVLSSLLILGCGQSEQAEPTTAAPAAAPAVEEAAPAMATATAEAGDVRVDRFADIEVLRYTVPGFDELSLKPPDRLFTRCFICNVPVDDASREEVEGKVPPYVFATQERFVRCPDCGRIYWSATHVANATRWLEDVLGASSNSGVAPPDPAAPSADARSARASEGATVKNLFVTGRPGVGKTTLIRRVLDELDVEPGGFYTSEMRAGGRRVGFAITDVRGGDGVLAHVDLESPHRVGKYGVNRADLERIGVGALLDAVENAAIVVMDEIGRMELCSEAFQRAVRKALDSSRPVLGTIQDRRNPFLDAVRSRGDVEVVRITEANRDAMEADPSDEVRRIIAEQAEFVDVRVVGEFNDPDWIVNPP